MEASLPQIVADHYVDLWNEPDGAKRRAVERLWAPNGTHYVGMREARGYEALMQRVTGSHDKNVRDGGYRFRAVSDANELRDVVTFHWEMIEPGTGRVAATGLEVLLLDAAQKIRVDYQFIVS